MQFLGEIREFKIDRVTEPPVHFVDGDTLHYAGFSLRNTLYDPPQRKDADARAGRLVAPMNGRVVSVHAKAGDTVARGKLLVVLEAMKMEHGLNLNFDSRIKSVHVAAGAQVSPGKLLVEFEPA